MSIHCGSDVPLSCASVSKLNMCTIYVFSQMTRLWERKPRDDLKRSNCRKTVRLHPPLHLETVQQHIVWSI